MSEINERGQQDVEGRWIMYKQWGLYNLFCDGLSSYPTAKEVSTLSVWYAKREAIMEVYKDLYGVHPRSDEEMEERYQAWVKEDAHAA